MKTPGHTRDDNEKIITAVDAYRKADAFYRDLMARQARLESEYREANARLDAEREPTRSSERATFHALIELIRGAS